MMRSHEETDRELRDYLLGLWAEKWLIVAIVVAVPALVTVAMVWFVDDRYESQTSVLIMPSVSSQLGTEQRLEIGESGTIQLREEDQQPTLLQPRAYERLARADDLVRTIIESLDLREIPNDPTSDPISVEALKRRVEVEALPGGQARSGDPRSVWLTIRVQGRMPAQVQQIAQAWAEQVIDRQRSFTEDAGQRTLDLLQRRLAEVKESLASAKQAKTDYLRTHSLPLLEAELDGLLDAYRTRFEPFQALSATESPKPAQQSNDTQTDGETAHLQQAIRARVAKLADVRATVAQLDRDIEVERDAYRNLSQRLQQAELARADRTPSIQVVERAIVPDEPTSARTAIYLVIALILGILLAIFLASFKRYILDPEDVGGQRSKENDATTEANG